ncbi:MAG: hypothetical protein ICV62_11635 [Cyanobacteria bacterium Co-bin13]|nr:hypothetical protein [Cyanobacteria bacterium Co-bin13]
MTDPWLGWRDQIVGEIEVQELPYDHFNLLKQPALVPLAKHLQAKLQSLNPVA